MIVQVHVEGDPYEHGGEVHLLRVDGEMLLYYRDLSGAEWYTADNMAAECAVGIEEDLRWLVDNFRKQQANRACVRKIMPQALKDLEETK